jgi:hypothetical protein
VGSGKCEFADENTGTNKSVWREFPHYWEVKCDKCDKCDKCEGTDKRERDDDAGKGGDVEEGSSKVGA